jgi:hypothetical protein
MGLDMELFRFRQLQEEAFDEGGMDERFGCKGNSITHVP